MKSGFITVVIVGFSALLLDTANLWSDNGDRFAKWSKIERAFRGPALKGSGNPNPFAISLDVVFKSPAGQGDCANQGNL